MKESTAKSMKPLRAPGVWTLLAATLVAAIGCKDGPQTVPVSGRVTLDGGPWPRRGMLFFAPVEPAEGFPRRPGVADFQEDGVFEATSFEPGDGLLPGKYLVNVECWEVPPSMGPGPPAKSAVPADQQNGVDCDRTLEVPVGGPAMRDVVFEVTSPK